MPKLVPSLLLGAGALSLLAYWQRSRLARVGTMIVDASKSALFQSVIPSTAEPYADVILQVAREQNIDPFIIVALGDRETRWGTGAGLDQYGPAGRGDSGHGHGLMQIDDRSWGSWLASNSWWDPYTNITKGVQVLKGKRAYLSGASQGTVTVGSRVAGLLGVSSGAYPDPRPLTGDILDQASIAAYNAGEGSVLQAYAAGGLQGIDKVTAGKNYSTDVLTKIATWTNSFLSQGGV